MTSPARSPLDLPPEIRNSIWEYVVVEEEPVPAYISQRVKMRDRTADATASAIHPPNLRGKRTIYQSKVFPEQPALASVSREVRAEILPIFYGLNTFVFNLTSIQSVSEWSRCASRRAKGRSSDGQIRRVIIEFDMQPIHRPLLQTAAVTRYGKHGEAEFFLAKDGAVGMSFGGELSSECCCEIERSLKSGLAERTHRRAKFNNDVLVLASRFETFIAAELFEEDRSRGEPACTVCGKENGFFDEYR